MRQIQLLLVILVVLFSCQETEKPVVSFANHTLTGTFERMVGNESGQIADVTLHFTNNTFEGTSDLARYPAICQGTFEIMENSIKFENSCFWTADFDWTLILEGEYSIIKTDDSLILTKEMGSGLEKITDIYRLQLADDQTF